MAGGLERALGELSLSPTFCQGTRLTRYSLRPVALLWTSSTLTAPCQEAAMVTSPEDLEPRGPAETLARNIEGWN